MKKFPIILSIAIVFSLFIFVGQTMAAESRAKAPLLQQRAAVAVEENEEGEKVRAREEQGEMLGETNQEREEIDGESGENSLREEKMSEVSKRVELLLEKKEDIKGIGSRVREIAKEQVKSQEKIAEKLQKMEQKKVWVKKMFGYDKEAVLTVKEEMTANQERIEELAELQSETTDKTEAAELQASIDALVDQNVSLDETVQEEMKEEGVWGWFRGFFKRD